MADEIAQLRHGMTRVTGAGGVSRELQVTPGLRVFGVRPLSLHTHVTVAAGRLPGRDREVPEKAVHAVFGRIEGRDRLIDDLSLVHAPAAITRAKPGANRISLMTGSRRHTAPSS